MVMIAPEPGYDTSEFPYLFVAMTLAWTLVPHGKLNGEAFKVATGIVH